jgi:hypothetical protein
VTFEIWPISISPKTTSPDLFHQILATFPFFRFLT